MSRFEEFWGSWPSNGKPPFDNYRRKTNPKGCEKVWNAKKLDEHADAIIRDVQQRALYDAQWLENKGQFMQGPHPYLNQENWRVPFADKRDEKKPKARRESSPQVFDTGPNISRYARFANLALLKKLFVLGGTGSHPGRPTEALARAVAAKNEIVSQAETEEWDNEDFKSVILRTIDTAIQSEQLPSEGCNRE